MTHSDFHFLESISDSNHEQLRRIDNEEQQYRQESEEITNNILNADIVSLAERLSSAAISGHIDPIKSLIAVKQMERFAKILTDKNPKTNKHAALAQNLNDALTEAITTHPEKSWQQYGATLTKTEVGTKYDYSVCNDPALTDLEAAAKAANDALKERQDFLKALPKTGTNIITADGEAVTVYPPAKSSTSTVSVSWK